jgi:hypothetical protein
MVRALGRGLAGFTVGLVAALVAAGIAMVALQQYGASMVGGL